MAAGGIWETLEDPESHAQLELNFYPDAPAYREGDELDHLGFQVTGLDEVVERLKALGGRIRIPPFREGETRLVFLSDPDGVWVELWERVEPEEPPTSRGGE
jgi:catechol 2,3-dioxygenase-like lactoylglutathione lyase family enzyme